MSYNTDLIRLLTILKDSATGYRARAFDIAIIAIKDLNYDINKTTIDRLKREITNKQVKGIGSGILHRIEEFVAKGTITEARDISIEADTIAEFMKIKGVGKKIARDWFNRGLRHLGDVKKAIGRREIEPTTAQKYGILYYYDLNERIPRREIDEYVFLLKGFLADLVAKFDVVGSYRRGAATSGDVDILIVPKKDNKKDNKRDNKRDSNKEHKKEITDIENAIKHDSSFIDVISEGENSLTYLYKYAGKVRQCDILLTDEVSYPAALLYFTGSKEHGIMLRKRAKTLNYTLNQYGLWRNEKRIVVKTEEDIYKKLGIKYVAPNLR